MFARHLMCGQGRSAARVVRGSRLGCSGSTSRRSNSVCGTSRRRAVRAWTQWPCSVGLGRNVTGSRRTWKQRLQSYKLQLQEVVHQVGSRELMKERSVQVKRSLSLWRRRLKWTGMLCGTGNKNVSGERSDSEVKELALARSQQRVVSFWSHKKRNLLPVEAKMQQTGSRIQSLRDRRRFREGHIEKLSVRRSHFDELEHEASSKPVQSRCLQRPGTSRKAHAGGKRRKDGKTLSAGSERWTRRSWLRSNFFTYRATSQARESSSPRAWSVSALSQAAKLHSVCREATRHSKDGAADFQPGRENPWTYAFGAGCRNLVGARGSYVLFLLVRYISSSEPLHLKQSDLLEPPCRFTTSRPVGKGGCSGPRRKPRHLGALERRFFRKFA